jgi:hypothetical protein
MQERGRYYISDMGPIVPLMKSHMMHVTSGDSKYCFSMPA